MGSRPTEGSPEGRHPAATAIWYSGAFVGVPTKGQAGVAFLLVTFLGAAEAGDAKKSNVLRPPPVCNAFQPRAVRREHANGAKVDCRYRSESTLPLNAM
ncbi:hypothetical protein HNQ50_000336 [Silvimonas terrae]|uniref:Uncharacterized protein n=1 Tax=Silvimonas terrae TaxID=300266 RepID=A0A840RAZ4_9NEIS|nr:hypothetical protein [Silvimonas terrae]